MPPFSVCKLRCRPTRAITGRLVNRLLSAACILVTNSTNDQSSLTKSKAPAAWSSWSRNLTAA